MALLNDTAKSLSHLYLLLLLHSPLPTGVLVVLTHFVCGCLKYEYDSATQLETAHFFTASKCMASQNRASSLVRGFSESVVYLTPVGRLLCSSIRCCVGQQAVGSEFLIKVDYNGADVGSTDWNVAEETLAPASQKDYTLVEGEKTR